MNLLHKNTIMANVQTAIKRLEFIIEDELTHCNIFYESSEPGNPFWGGGWKTKTFGKSVSAAAILTDSKHGLSDYIMWNNGRSGVA